MILQEARIFVARFVKGDHTPEEYATFLRWLEGASTEELEEIAKEYEALFGDWSIPAIAPSQAWISELESKLDLADEKEGVILAPIVRMDRSGMVKRIVTRLAAASVVLAVGVGSYLWFTHQSGSKSGLSGTNQEVLSKIISVPKGGMQQQFELPDGSKVWLNAESSLKYPIAFNGSDRLVELKGEAYFEISKDARLPFRIGIGAAQIEVLGTRFNVRAYPMDVYSKTTLVDGSIKVIRGKDEVLVKPGEQVEVKNGAVDGEPGLRVIRGIDLETVTSWRGGILTFRNDKLGDVMDRIGRFYGVEVEIRPGVMMDREFTGTLSRKLEINQVIKLLEKQNIHCSLKDGNTIVVMH